MARRFIGTGQVPYIGVPYTRPVPICRDQKGNPLNTAVPLSFDWNAYGASSINNTINVLVKLNTPDVKSGLLGAIRSVYIDNTNSITPIYVYAPDTQYVATAQPNSAGWYPLYTNGLDIWVIGIGFVNGQIPYTTIFVSDLFVPPYTDLEIAQTQILYKASPTIQLSTSLFQQGNYAVPSIGDQIANAEVDDMTANDSSVILPPQVSGFYYIKSICAAWTARNSAGANIGARLQFIDTPLTKVVYNYPFTFSAAQISGVSSLSGMDVKLDATRTWELSYTCTPNPSTIGNVSFNVCFTYNPLNP